MIDIKKKRTAFVLSSVVLATTATTAALLRYVRREMQNRGYPSWDECRCDFKSQSTIFQVWNSHHEQRGETIVTHEWGIYLVKPAQWFRHLMHYSAQTLAILNPRNRYVERVTLSPQKAYLFAAMLHASISNEDLSEEFISDQSYIVWRREILHFPRYVFDACISRLYPAQVAPERFAQAEPLPALWDPASSLPLPSEGPLLETPPGTRIDCIGWTPSQIAYCTARVNLN